jgi:ribosomal protein S18 acetylase RimI-like enzyme
VSDGFAIAFPTELDIPELARLHVKCWQQAYSHIMPADFLAKLSVEKRIDGWAKTLADSQVFSPAARDGSDWVGFMHCGPSRQEFGDGEIYGIYVDASHYRRGIGRTLLKLGFRDLKSRGYGNAVLGVLCDNVRAREFYEAMGGNIVDASKHFTINGVDYPEVIYSFYLHSMDAA